MPKEAQQLICERKPGNLLDAARLAEEFFSNQERDFSSWESTKTDSKPPSDSSRRGRHNKRGKSWKRRDSLPSPPKASQGNQQQREKRPTNTDKGKRDSSKPKKCSICGGVGHFRADCPQTINRIEDSTEAKKNYLSEKARSLGSLVKRSC